MARYPSVEHLYTIRFFRTFRALQDSNGAWFMGMECIARGLLGVVAHNTGPEQTK